MTVVRKKMTNTNTFNQLHVNIANNRWALKVLYNPSLSLSHQPTFIVQTTPSSRTNRPQTIIEVNLTRPSTGTNELNPFPATIVVRQHLLNNTIATIIQSNQFSSFYEPILTADVIAQTIDFHHAQSLGHSQCAICLFEFNSTGILLQLSCQHVYHRECLLRWLQTHCQCPYCRFLVYQSPVTPHIFLVQQINS